MMATDNAARCRKGATTMKIKRELRKAINAAIRQHGMGASFGEVGYRENGDGQRTHTNNALTWPKNEDLWDTRRFADVKELDDDPANPGCYALDIYAYSRDRWGVVELETNVYVFIRDGAVVLATNKDLRAKSMAAEIGFPSGKNW
jgi:hypothetical protein